MRVLIVGNGAREHAIAWKVRQSPQVSDLFVAPGNAGTAALGTNLPVAATDIEGVARAATQRGADLVIIGPEAPLAEGLADRLRVEGLAVLGPSKTAARLEASKIFAKELMRANGVPTARFEAFDSLSAALAHVERRSPPMVVKADGLAAGKGVTVAATRDEAAKAVRACLEEGVFGEAGRRILIEDCLAGREVSVFAFTDGEALSPLVAACDYKRAYDGDRGPNTGGMGSYSPPEFWGSSLAEEVQSRILEPTLRALARAGTPYQGVLYAGLMLTKDGPQVLEFNCRLGDPETQVILPLLETDLVEVAEAVVEARLARQEVAWSGEVCVGVVVASEGYPGSYRKGLPIGGLREVGEAGALVFHAGTRLAGEEGEPQVLTDGGRVLTVVGRGPTLTQARQRAYAAVRHVTFEGAFYRKDIAEGRG